MTEIHAFAGSTLCTATLELGEGPTYDAVTDTLWWFNIKGKQLHELDLATGDKSVHALPMMASVLARIDDARQLLVTEDGLFIRDTASGALTPYVAIEPDKPGNRSNDGRMHPSGALWASTMGKKAETGAGAIYHVAGSRVTRLFDNLSIPNAICFSPDGRTGYFVDTVVNQLMYVDLDPSTGLPTGAPSVLIDRSAEDGGMDGAVCDAEGRIWNACWGQGAVDVYSAQGTHLARYDVPAQQSSCPVFFGKDADRMAVTSAAEGYDAAALASDPKAGHTFDLGIAVPGVLDVAFKL